MKWILVMIFLFQTSTLQAQITAQELLNRCTNEEDGLDTGMCIGYIMGLKSGQKVTNSVAFLTSQGMYKMMNNMKMTEPIDPKKLAGLKEISIAASVSMYSCWGDKSYGQIQAVFLKYIKARPKLWHKDATEILLEAMKDAFPEPCEYIDSNNTDVK